MKRKVGRPRGSAIGADIGSYTFTLPASLRQRIEDAAQREGRSKAGQIRWLVERALDDREAKVPAK